MHSRGSQVWLAAAALLFTTALFTTATWGMPRGVSPTGHASRPGVGGLALAPAPVAVTTATAKPRSAATPAITMAPRSAFVVGIGDSVTSATACACTGFVESYAAQLPTAAGGPAREVNLGIGGLTADGLRVLMTEPSPTARRVAQGDILLVTIGANDLTPLLSRWRASGCPVTCYSPAVDAVGSDVRAILTAAKDLRGNGPTQILVTNYWNVFADGDIARASDGSAYLRWSDELTRAVNRRICSVARNAGALCVDLYAPFKGDGSRNPTALLAADGDHPNAAGNQLIASTLLAATATVSR